MYDTAEEIDTVGLDKTGEFNIAHSEYVDIRIAARHTCDGRGLKAAYEDCRNKGLAVRDHYLRELDLRNGKRIDERLADLERDHSDLVRELRGI